MDVCALVGYLTVKKYVKIYQLCSLQPFRREALKLVEIAIELELEG